MARLGDYVRIRTGKLDANASSENGQYPFFTCAVEPLRIDSYSYDCECVLVAGNGDLNVKYYNGKFDAYQRTYIIESLDKMILSVPYLFCFLDKYVEKLRTLSIGGVIKYIKLGNLTEANIPLPKIQEQYTIVELCYKVNTLLSLRKQQLAKLDELVKSRFIEIVNEKQPIKTAEEVCSVIIDCPHSTPRYDEAALIYPSIRTSEIRNGEIDWSSMKYVGENEYYERTKRLTPQPGDIVYAREGTYGDCVILPVGYSFCLGQRTMLFRPDGVICNSIYLHQALRSDDVKRQANESNAGSTVPHVNVADAKKFSFPLPSIAVQSRFAAFVAQVDKSKLAVQQSIDQLETLKKSLMQKYFG